MLKDEDLLNRLRRTEKDGRYFKDIDLIVSVVEHIYDVHNHDTPSGLYNIVDRAYSTEESTRNRPEPVMWMLDEMEDELPEQYHPYRILIGAAERYLSNKLCTDMSDKLCRSESAERYMEIRQDLFSRCSDTMLAQASPIAKDRVRYAFAELLTKPQEEVLSEVNQQYMDTEYGRRSFKSFRKIVETIVDIYRKEQVA